MASSEARDEVARELRKLANLVALSQMAGLSVGEQARRLAWAGFSNGEIAALTGSTEGSIRALLSRMRRRGAPGAEE